MSSELVCRARMSTFCLAQVLLLGLMVWPTLAIAEPAADDPLLAPDPRLKYLGAISLEELMAIQITSVSGVETEWFKSPAAVYVINRDEVRRSGLRKLAEVLRLAPGVFVGQSGSHRWSVGTRGFNGDFSNKTLVQIDGRAVYDPLFGGTNWDVQDILLEDLDLIEVIRGPGPTLWGANAVNGVFSVTTRSSEDTQGLYLSTGVGSGWERGFAEIRYGGQIDDETWFRVWGKYSDYDALELPGPDDNHDDWDFGRTGFRIDRDGADGTHVTLQGDIYASHRLGEIRSVPVLGVSLVTTSTVEDGRNAGGNILLRIAQEDRQEDSGWSFQTYYDRTEHVEFTDVRINRDTFDAEFRHHFRPLDRHELMWGLGVRSTVDHIHDGVDYQFDPSSGSFTTVHAFIQDTITLLPEELFAMIGTKLEHNSYTGFEYQPSGRIWWTPGDRQTLWAAVTRAVRVPTRIENDGTFIFGFIDEGLLGGTPGNIVSLGLLPNDDLDSEAMVAYELGYRLAPMDNFSIDLALFFNDYDRLIFAATSPFNMPYVNGAGESYGGELTITWQPADNLKVLAGFSYVGVDVRDIFPSAETNTPHHQAQLRANLDVTRDLELNAAMYYVDNVPGQVADHYIRLDAGVTWRLKPNLELSVWGQNLLEPYHPEFGAVEVGRGVYSRLTLRF